MNKIISMIILFIGVSGYFTSSCFAEVTLKSGYEEMREEDLQLYFDGRDWVADYETSNEQQSLVEYVLKGETVNNWSELVTAHTSFGLQQIATPEEVMENTRKQLQLALQMRPSLEWDVLRKGANDVMYEWSVTDDPQQGDQHEIARIISGKKAIYTIRYTTKNVPISPEKRQEWIDLLDSVILKKTLSLPPTEDEAQSHFNKGMSLVYEGKPNEAIKEFKKTIELDPEFYVAYFNMGLCYKSLKEFEEALVYIRKTSEVNPDWHEAYLESGKIHYLLKQYDEAIVGLEKGLSLEPNAPDCNMLAHIYMKKKSDIDKAIKYYQKGIDLDANNIEAYETLAYIYASEKNDLDKAIEYYEKMTGVAPDYPDAYKNMGIAYLNKGDKDSASEQVKKLRELKRDDMAEQLQGYIDQME